jgi:antitoxin CptB
MPMKGLRKSMPGVRLLALEEPMTGMARSSEGLDQRRRQLLFRAWHRGLREMDLILGRFADTAVETLSDHELTEFEQLVEVPDRELLAWVIGEVDVPDSHDTPLFRRLREFNRSGEAAS